MVRLFDDFGVGWFSFVVMFFSEVTQDEVLVDQPVNRGTDKRRYFVR
jgi:hypothetical protein